jgi:N-acetylglucosaminyldiphosphoundecaprenol N-acetyl-beta-D-mannosaminyltransferase
MGVISNGIGHRATSLADRSRGRVGFRRILGVDFFYASASEAVERMQGGGLLVAPAAPALISLPLDKAYRDALLGADLALADSGFMVLLWNLLENDQVVRLSGLKYFARLVADPEFRQPGKTLYVMASEESARTNAVWLRRQGISVEAGQIYIAPDYRDGVVDPVLVERILGMRPKHVLVTVGGGVQERLGLYLKRSLDYSPSIHCIGAAIAFRSGDQVRIPDIADRFHLGWLLRCLWRPRSYVPRYWAARRLAWLVARYRTEMPPVSVVPPTHPEEHIPSSLSGIQK